MTTGVLLMGYGSPDSVSDVERYLRNIRASHARPGQVVEPTGEEVERLRHRYEAIGGISPFNRITGLQARALQDSLASMGADARVYTGMLNWEPSIASAAASMANDGVSGIIAMPVAPIYSQASIGGYSRALEAGIARVADGLKATFVGPWYLSQEFIGIWADAIKAKMAAEPATIEDTHVVFTAHSLPRHALSHGDTYQKQFRELCEAIAVELRLRHWSPAYQSASGPGWLGPSLAEKLDELATGRATKIMIAPVGFVTENLETLYDIDIECVDRLRSHGVAISRVGLPNSSPRFIDVLASAAITSIGQRVRN